MGSGLVISFPGCGFHSLVPLILVHWVKTEMGAVPACLYWDTQPNSYTESAKAGGQEAAACVLASVVSVCVYVLVCECLCVSMCMS